MKVEDRLTRKSASANCSYFRACVKFGVVKSCKELCTECNQLHSAIQTLSAYEDTGLSPEEVEKLKAENANLRARLGKSVELSCKVGDTVYNVGFTFLDGYDKFGKMIADCGYRVSPFIIKKESERLNAYARIMDGTAFLTREEAEARLAELKGEKR